MKKTYHALPGKHVYGYLSKPSACCQGVLRRGERWLGIGARRDWCPRCSSSARSSRKL
jgi:hypothetical protein